MTAQTGKTLTAWSVAAYSIVLHAYPVAFRREFGESMIQAFGAWVRDAYKQGRVTGVARLWMRTVPDVGFSLIDAYLGDRRNRLFRLTRILCLLYIGVLVFSVAYGGMRFAEFYEPPAFSVFGSPNAHEDALLAAYERALTGEFGSYYRFAVTAGLTLAILLGATSALFGLWQKSLAHGAAALIAGVGVTVVAFELLPTVWFPLDRYAVGALWTMGGTPVVVGTWLAVSALGRFRLARTAVTHP